MQGGVWPREGGVQDQGGVRPRDTVVSACLLGQFGLILWQETSDGAYFFWVRDTKKFKTVLDQKIPQKNYRRCKSCLSVVEHLKKYFFSKIILKKSKNICETQKNFNLYSFHSIVLPLCVSKQFSLSMQPLPKKSTRGRRFFSPIGWCDFTPAWQTN